MLGPLPFLYRVIVAVVALLAFGGLGAWLANTLPIQHVARAGVGIGAALGILVVALLLHGSTSPTPRNPGLRRPHH